MMKRARFAVDCCGETLRIIWPLKAGFPYQSEGTFKLYTEEVLIFTQVCLVFFTSLQMKYESCRVRLSSSLPATKRGSSISGQLLVSL